MKKESSKSIYLKEFEKKIQENNLKVVSFDIFDTLFFRKCALPSTIFRLTGEHEEVLDIFGDADAFMNYRMEAERQAREKDSKKEEITLDEIYSAFDLPVEVVKRLQQIELEVEKENLVVNHAMEELIQLAHDSEKKIILISDMYLSKEQIEYICLWKLNSVNLISEIWVSSEYGKTKRKGSLFEEILMKEQIEPREMLHIGDNLYADYISPLKIGISTILYNDNEVFMKMKEHEILYAREDELNDAHIRRYAVLQQPYNDPIRNFYYVFGSFILGPLLYGFNRWLNKIAEERGCRKIFFFMREGWLLKYFFDKQYPQYDTKLIYSSRDATMPLIYESNMDDLVSHIISRGIYKVGDIYQIMDMEIENVEIQKYKNEQLNNAWRIKIQDGNLLEMIGSDLKRNVKNIESGLREKKQIVMDYFLSLEIEKDDMVIDFGPGGTILNRLGKIEHYKKSNFVLFYMDAKGSKAQIRNKTLSFLPYRGITRKHINAIRRTPAIFENIFNLDNKSTYGYLKKGDTIVPVFKKTESDSENLKKIKESLMKGIEGYMYAADRYRFESEVLDRRYLAIIMSRVIEFPTRQEVRWFSKWEYDEGDGSSKSFRIIEKNDVEKAANEGLDKWYMEYRSNESAFLKWRLWPEGIMTKIDPDFLARIYRRATILEIGNKSKIGVILEKLKEQKITETFIYGVGEFYRELSPLLELMDVKIEKLIDLRAEVDSFYVDGKKVLSLDEALNNETQANIIIASGAYVKEISEKILIEQRRTGLRVNIISI